MATYPHQSAKYVADIAPVHEVSLAGAADLAYWSERLKPVGLVAQTIDGRAQLVVSAMQPKFMGLTFREVCIAVTAKCSNRDDEASDALYLLQAFNSSRLFTFSERVFFSTPYRHARIDVVVNGSASFRIHGEAAPWIDARFDAGARGSQAPIRTSQEHWEGPIFLPMSSGAGSVKQRYFRARIAGLTTVWPFDGSVDRFELATNYELPVFGQLRESGFAAREWHLRPNANHARSKTFDALE